jgi:membrane protein required for colicin V production
MNPFDAFVIAVTVLAVVMGYTSGLLRSLATILGYLTAAPIAIAIAPAVTAFVLGRIALPPSEAWIPLFTVFIAVGFVFGSLIRKFVNEIVGPDPGLFDRVAGAALGAMRIFLLAVLVVVAFDRIIPADHQPPFLVGSRLRPYLSAAGQKGLQSLPPDVAEYIDRLKRERGL